MTVTPIKMSSAQQVTDWLLDRIGEGSVQELLDFLDFSRLNRRGSVPRQLLHWITTNPPSPQQPQPCQIPYLAGLNPEDCYGRVKQLIQASGIRVGEGYLYDERTGIIDRHGSARKDSISVGLHLQGEMRLAVLLHELTHVVANHFDELNDPDLQSLERMLVRIKNEAVADSTQYQLMRHLGFQGIADERRFVYHFGTLGHEKMFRDVFEQISIAFDRAVAILGVTP